jgi:hypothetical protein
MARVVVEVMPKPEILDPQGKAIVAIELDNKNTDRNITVRNILIDDPAAHGGLKPVNPVSLAQDALLGVVIPKRQGIFAAGALEGNGSYVLKYFLHQFFCLLIRVVKFYRLNKV